MYGKHVPEKEGSGHGADTPIEVKDESKLGAIAVLLDAADQEPETDKRPLNEDWLGEVEAAAREGVVTGQQRMVISFSTVDLQGPRTLIAGEEGLGGGEEAPEEVEGFGRVRIYISGPAF
jgi:hypothetical protein